MRHCGNSRAMHTPQGLRSARRLRKQVLACSSDKLHCFCVRTPLLWTRLQAGNALYTLPQHPSLKQAAGRQRPLQAAGHSQAAPSARIRLCLQCCKWARSPATHPASPNHGARGKRNIAAHEPATVAAAPSRKASNSRPVSVTTLLHHRGRGGTRLGERQRVV